MAIRYVSATEMRRHTERLLREVEETGVRLIVTRYGKPMVAVKRYEEATEAAQAKDEGPRSG